MRRKTPSARQTNLVVRALASDAQRWIAGLILTAAAGAALGDPVPFEQQAVDGRHAGTFIFPHLLEQSGYVRYAVNDFDQIIRDVDLGGIDDGSDAVPIFSFPEGTAGAGVDAADEFVYARVYPVSGVSSGDLVADNFDHTDSATLSLDRSGQGTIEAKVAAGPNGIYNVLSLHINPGTFTFELVDRTYRAIDDVNGVEIIPLDEQTVGTFTAFGQQPGAIDKQYAPDGQSAVITWAQVAGASTTLSRVATIDPVTGAIQLSPLSTASNTGGNPALAVGGHTVAIVDADSTFQQGRVGFCSYDQTGVNLGGAVYAPLDPGASESYPGLAVDRCSSYGSNVDTFLCTWDRDDPTPDDPGVSPGDYSLLETQVAQQFNEFGRAVSGRCTIADTSRHEFTLPTLSCDAESGNALFGATGFDYAGGGFDAVTSTFNIRNDILAELDNEPTLVILSENCPTPITDATAVFDNTQITGDCDLTIDQMPGQSDNYGFKCDWTGDATYSFTLSALTDGEKALFDPATHDIYFAYDIQFDQTAVDADAKVRMTFQRFDALGQVVAEDSQTVHANQLQTILSHKTILLSEELQEAISYHPDGSVDYLVTWEFLAESDPTVWIDNLSIWVEPVPEPGTGWLLICAAAMLRRRGG